ncbi:MAG: hypothetical protein IKN62_01420 [Elusimicrobia bacterium]|nr:hypothetical protein [Elusimicrobiota bacterium]
MRIGSLLLELLIVLAIIFCLYYISMSKTKATFTNEKGQLITEDYKSIINDANRVSAGAMRQKKDLEAVLRAGAYNGTRRQREKKDLERKVNRMMKRHNVN